MSRLANERRLSSSAQQSQSPSRLATDYREISSGPKPFHRQGWPRGVRQMLNGLGEVEFRLRRASPLQQLCGAGSEYGIKRLEEKLSSDVLPLLRPRPKQRVKTHLRLILARATRPCVALELDAFRRVYWAVCPEQTASTLTLEKTFLRQGPYDRLLSLFSNFPILPKLWCCLIDQWCDSISELLARVDADKDTLSRVFFRGQPVGEIVDVRPGLSDPHNNGRTVMRVQFQAGSLIYKPRSGHGEREWFRLIAYLNSMSFRPRLSAARVVCRRGYCWMEEIKFRSCKDRTEGRRFYRRLGGMIAAAYLLDAVDCHRDNVIASGEHPVLIDAEALWHGSEEKKTNCVDALHATGFLSATGRRSSYQYRSSLLGRTSPGAHTPHVGGTPLEARNFVDIIVAGFRQAWYCLLGTKERRVAFVRYLRNRPSRGYRRIYRSTAEYDAIIQASVQPAAMRDDNERNRVIAQSFLRNGAGQIITREEINALRRLDIPYFARTSSSGPRLPTDTLVPAELIEALRRGVHL